MEEEAEEGQLLYLCLDLGERVERPALPVVEVELELASLALHSPDSRAGPVGYGSLQSVELQALV